MNIGEIIDDYYLKRAARLEAQRKTDEAKSAEELVKALLIEKLQELGLAKASGSIATAGIKTVKIPRVIDWDQLYTWIRTNDRFDMLHKRISEVAWRDMISAGENIPGTESMDDIKLSLTKSSR